MFCYKSLKRSPDVLATTLLILLTGPLLLGIAAAIRLRMGAPVLFRQQRLGLDGEAFTILKFRTMREPEPGEDLVDSDADRITPIGAWLRKTSLDELPTLLNVLRGDMSLVGPRPLMAKYRDRYDDWQRRRHEVRPGITGWAQVHGRNNLSWDEKFEHDVWYVEHRSLTLDLKILAMTAREVLRTDRVNRSDDATMPEFRPPEDA